MTTAQINSKPNESSQHSTLLHKSQTDETTDEKKYQLQMKLSELFWQLKESAEERKQAEGASNETEEIKN